MVDTQDVGRRAKVLAARGQRARRPGHRNVAAGPALASWARGSVRGAPPALSRFYPRSARGDLEKFYGEAPYVGKNVTWFGRVGSTFPVPAEYVYPIDGNIFDPDKLLAVAHAVRRGPVTGPVTFDVAYGQFAVLDRADIAESIEYGSEVPWGRPYTTGDAAMDDYLLDADAAVLQSHGVEPGERGHKTAVAYYERALRALERAGAGDFGALVVQVRDGNHRVFGAIAGGEPVVWVRMMDNQVQDMNEFKPWTRPLRKALRLGSRQRL